MESLKKLIARVLEIEESSVTDDASPTTIASWDSYNGLLLVSAIEKNFHLKLTTEETVSVQSIGDIKKVLQKHGIKEDLEL